MRGVSAQTWEIKVVFHKVLIAVDDDPIAAHAAEVGLELAHSLHSGMHVLQFIPQGPAGSEILKAARAWAHDGNKAHVHVRWSCDLLPSSRIEAE